MSPLSDEKSHGEALQQREQHFRLLAEAIQDYAIFALNPDGNVSTWNSGAERINGFNRSEIIGKHFSCFYPEEDRRAGKPERELAIAAREGRFEDEGWRVRKDGSRFWANAIIIALRDDEGRINGYAHVTRDSTRRGKAEEALRQSEEGFRLVVEGAQDYAIFMLDPEGRITSWNRGAERIKGYQTSEIIGQHFSCFYPEEDRRAGKPEQELAIAAREGRFEDEGWRVRKDGSHFWANVIITALHDHTGRLRGFGKVTRDVTERMEAERRLRESEQSLRELSGRLLRMQDEERRRIGRELHDTVGQCLVLLKMGLDYLSSDAGPKGDETRQHLEECVRLAEQAIKEVRTLSYLLYPPMLEEMGLQAAIEWYLEGFTKRGGIRTTLAISPDFGRLPRDIELTIFRVLQESLTNVHRHSGSSRAHIRLLLRDKAAILEVKDEGKGVPSGTLPFVHDAPGTLGVGVRSMSERVRQLGGNLEFTSAEEGTTVTAVIPLGESPPAPPSSG